MDNKKQKPDLVRLCAKVMSVALLIATTIDVILFYFKHTEVFGMSKFMILVNHGLFGVLLPFLGYFLAGWLWWISKDD